MAAWACHPTGGRGARDVVALAPASAEVEDFISAYQRALYGGLPPDATSEHPAIAWGRVNDSFIFGLCEEVLLTHIDDKQPLPTTFTNPDLVHKCRLLLPFVKNAAAALRASMPDARLPALLPEAPLVATLPLPSIQAVAVPLPVGNDDYFIAMSEGSSLWIHRLARLTLCVISVNAEGDVLIADASSENYHRRVEAEPGVIPAAANSILQIAVGGLNDWPRPDIPVEPASDRAVCELAMAMHLFVLSHEYAHALLEHRRESLPARQRQPVRASRAPAGPLQMAYAASWQDEIEADFVGTLLFLHAIDGMAAEGFIMSPARCRAWTMAPLIFVAFSTAAESAHALASDRFDPHFCPPGGVEDAKAYATTVVESLVAGRRRPEEPPPLFQPYPNRAARLKAALLGVAAYLRERREQPSAPLSDAEKANLKGGVELVRRVEDLLADSAARVNAGLPLARHLLRLEEDSR